MMFINGKLPIIFKTHVNDFIFQHFNFCEQLQYMLSRFEYEK